MKLQQAFVRSHWCLATAGAVALSVAAVACSTTVAPETMDAAGGGGTRPAMSASTEQVASPTATMAATPAPAPSLQLAATPAGEAASGQSTATPTEQPSASPASGPFDDPADEYARPYESLSPGGERSIDPSRWRQSIPRDAILPVYEPRFVSPDDISLIDEELVMGVEINGDVRAYPVGLLRFREIVNDEVGGVPILVTW